MMRAGIGIVPRGTIRHGERDDQAFLLHIGKQTVHGTQAQPGHHPLRGLMYLLRGGMLLAHRQNLEYRGSLLRMALHTVCTLSQEILDKKDTQRSTALSTLVAGKSVGRSALTVRAPSGKLGLPLKEPSR